MRGARVFGGGIVGVCLFVLVGAPGAQAPTTEEPTPGTIQPGTPRPAPTPTQPTPGPEVPTGPAVPTPPPAKTEEEPRPQVEPTVEQRRIPEQIGPTREATQTAPFFVGPDLFNPPAPQGWLTITPSFTLSGEYNDNIFLSSTDKRSDVIFGLTPGVTVTMRRPGFRLLAGYNIGGEVFVRESSLSDFGKEQRFSGDLFYQISPRLTFTLSDQFIFARDSNAITAGGVSVGRRDAYRNTLTPRLRFQATPSTGFSLVGSYTAIRFSDTADKSESTGEVNSDTYRGVLGIDQRITARATGLLNFEVAYFNFEGQSSARTYTPTVGLAYQITPTLRASVGGGPSILDRDGDTSLSPRLTASVEQTFKFGSLQFGYERSIAAETIGISDSQVLFASLVLPTLLRGLSVELTPRYTIEDTDVSGNTRGSENSSVKTLTLNLRARYQIARNISVIGSYTFFRQRGDRQDTDIDQNRVFFGLQYAFPINFY